MSSPGITALGPRPAAPSYRLAELPNGLRVFENQRIQSAVDQAISSLRDSDTWAVVGHHVYNDDGTRVENVTKLSLVVRLDAGFSVAVGAYKDWQSGSQGVEGKVVFRR